MSASSDDDTRVAVKCEQNRFLGLNGGGTEITASRPVVRCRTVVGKSTGDFMFVREGLTFVQGGLDIQILQKFH